MKGKFLENETEATTNIEEKKSILRPDYEQEIIGIIKSNASPRIMRERLENYHENDIAEVLPKLTVVERKKLYRIMDVEMLSGVFVYNEIEEAIHYLEEMDLKKSVSVISAMEADDALEILREIDKKKRAMLVELMDESSRKDVMLLSSFDEEEIGSRMTMNFIAIRENLTIKQAMKSVGEQAAKNDNISTIFVVDESGAFYGAIELRDLITTKADVELEEIIVTSYPYVYGYETIDESIEDLKDYSENSIPVLDNNNHLLGVITSQNIIQLVDDEMGEDYAKLAGLTAEEDLKESLKESMKKRMPWLLILLCLGMVVSSVVGVFENVVSQLTIIMSFQSLILDMAGNVGTQSLAVTIRVLMDETLTTRQKCGLIIKEIRVGSFNGILLGSVSFVLIGLYIWQVKGKTLIFAYAVSGCVGVSLLVAMIISSAVGTIIPMFFKKIKVDPAVASGPLITTVNDLVAVVTYYGMSWLLLLRIMNLG